MDPTARNAHAGHDELLIARVFGGDASESERVRALGLMSTCPECKSLYADLGAVSEAMSGLSSPARPRDFRLTELDAARLGRPPRARWAVFGPGLRRSLGGSLAALGIVGVLLTGVSSVLSGAAGTSGAGFALGSDRAAAAPEQAATVASSGGTIAFGAAGGPTAGPAILPTTAPAASAAASAGGAILAATSPAPAADTGSLASLPATTSPAGHDVAAASPGPVQGKIAAGSEPNKASPGAVVGSGGVDARPILLTGFAALFVLGLVIATLPGRRRGRDRDATS